MAVPPPSPAADKATLRRSLRAARIAHVDAIDGDGVADAIAAITRTLLPLLDRAGPIAGYVAHRGEPDILGVLRGEYEHGRRAALPRVDGDEIRFVDWRPKMALSPGYRGIAEPPPEPEILPATLLVPLVGFDRAGHRLGQGAGCYDRWLAAHPGTRAIGVAWSVQECAAIPVDPWDVPLEMIVTERECIRP